MSWFQNIFEMFKKEEEVLDEQLPLHNTIPMASKESSKELEARITYQYPKGQFRFPVIPDDNRTKKHHDDRTHRKQKNQEMQDNKEYVRSKPEPIIKSKKYSYGAFRPTEIPSPIFGFNRPKKAVVEHELSHFSVETFEHQESHSNDNENAMMNNEAEVTSKQMIEPGESDASLTSVIRKSTEDNFERVDANNLLQKETPPDEMVSKADDLCLQDPKPVFSETLDEEPILQEDIVVSSDPSLTKEDIVVSGDPSLTKENIVVSSDPSLTKEDIVVSGDPSLTKEDIVVSGDPSLTKEDIAVSGAPSLIKEDIVISGALSLIKEDITDFTETETSEKDSTAGAPFQKREETEAAANETVIETDVKESLPMSNEQYQNSEYSNVEKPKRNHLPFNVLMLKQDKQKWAENSKKQNEFVQDSMMKPSVKADSFIEDRADQPSGQTGAGSYDFPPYSLLNPPVTEAMDSEWLLEQEKLLNQTLENFNVGAKVVNMTQGPSVTRFEVQPDPGVKVNKVTNLTDDIKLSLAARDIRIEAPIPGKHTIGIEVPNQKSRPVLISEIIHTQVFRESVSPLTAVLGLDISGKPIVTDLKKMPHGLIAGATGSGKSVCINTILVSLLYKARPEDLKLLLIDPKMVELAPYNQIPHLVSPVITDVKAATAALKWAVEEMERRYELFAHAGVRDINRFNELAMHHKRYSDKLPFIVIVIDELADLMMMSPADVEEAICRIAQKARACGIHLIIATQRPSVDVITGLIKANIPTRIAFSVSSQVDSRTIIDISGAEKLLGRGDMLFLENGSSKPVRLQGTFVSDEEIDYVAGHVREQREPDYLFEQDELLKKAQVSEEEDELFYEACEFVVDQNGASTSSLQRRFKIGYNRAARLMDMMEQQGFISGAKGSKPRDVLITEADLEGIQEASF